MDARLEAKLDKISDRLGSIERELVLQNTSIKTLTARLDVQGKVIAPVVRRYRGMRFVRHAFVAGLGIAGTLAGLIYTALRLSGAIKA